MNCSEVVARLTEYLDGDTSSEEAASIQRHFGACSACVRYRHVVVHGGQLLRSLPEPELRADFEPRLHHRLFHVDDERLLGVHAASGTPAMTVLGIALLLTAVAWSPTMFAGARALELAPIVVDRAPSRSPVRAASSPPGVFSSKMGDDLDEGLWENTILYDYTPLSQRYDQQVRGRQRFLPDR